MEDEFDGRLAATQMFTTCIAAFIEQQHPGTIDRIHDAGAKAMLYAQIPSKVRGFALDHLRALADQAKRAAEG